MTTPTPLPPPVDVGLQRLALTLRHSLNVAITRLAMSGGQWEDLMESVEKAHQHPIDLHVLFLHDPSFRARVEVYIQKRIDEYREIGDGQQ